MVSNIILGVILLLVFTIITALIIIGKIINNHKHLKKIDLKINFYGCCCSVSLEAGSQD